MAKKTFFSFVALLLFGATAFANSGGPYEAVPDLRKDEQPPIFQIPASKEPLRYFLQNMPKLNRNKKLNEPDSYSWTRINGYYASFRVLGHVRGRRVYEVRYVSDSRIEQGLDYADAILILARVFDSSPDKGRLEPIYFSTGGISYDRRAEHLPQGDKYGALKVTEEWAGTGSGRWRSVFIRGTEDFKYERFTPDEPKAKQGADAALDIPAIHAALTNAVNETMTKEAFSRKIENWYAAFGHTIKIDDKIDKGESGHYFTALYAATSPDFSKFNLFQPEAETPEDYLSIFLKGNDLTTLPFDSKLWINWKQKPIPINLRYRMFKDFLSAHTPVGQTKAEIKAMLGPSDVERWDSCSYCLGFGTNIDRLFVDFTFKDDKVSAYRFSVP